ncbi:hypothetical protein Hdeb2414_s0021g00578531 [Helianthus debilis subsp. tardiflorus]
MMSDLEERERSAFAANDASAKATSEEESIARKLKEEISRIRAMHANKSTPTVTATMKKQNGVGETSNTGPSAAEKEKMLKVSWEKGGLDYSAQRLRELLRHLVRSKMWLSGVKRKKDQPLWLRLETMCGDISNPLLVVPLQPAVATSFPMAREPVVPQRNEELVGAGYQAFEDSVLTKTSKGRRKTKTGQQALNFKIAVADDFSCMCREGMKC